MEGWGEVGGAEQGDGSIVVHLSVLALTSLVL